MVTVGNFEVRNLVLNDASCKNCSLKPTYTGEIFLNGSWHFTRWDKNGRNLSNISSFNIIIPK